MSPPPPRATDDGHRITLRDGSHLFVRPIRPDDKDLLVEGLTRLSPRSRYLRFHTHLDHLTGSQLDYLVDVDHHDHEALVAFDLDSPGTPGVGVARYIRLKEDPTVAEAAITVVDSHQGRGIGTTLIGLLEHLAHERGITTFRNYVLAENTAMLEIFRQLDGQIAQEGPGLYRVDVPVPAPDATQPATPAGQWVSSIARQNAAPAAADRPVPLVWLLRIFGVGVDEDPEDRAHLLKDIAARAFGGGAEPPPTAPPP